MSAPPPAPAAAASCEKRKTNCLPHVYEAIHGKQPDAQAKKVAYERSLSNWWTEYADRKNDEEDEHVADSLLYDRNHLPRSAPAPECVQRDMAAAQAAQRQQRQATAAEK